jgi:GNAT superfamily N-acetyltransferase
MARSDVRAVARIEAAREGGASTGPFEARLRRQLADVSTLLLVASIDGEIAGFGRAAFIARPADAPPDWIPEGWYLVGVVVVDAWRRAGIGRALTEARLAWIAERAERAYYFTNARNQASLDLHRALGFRELTRSFTGPGIAFDGGHGVLDVIELREVSR